MVQTTVYRHRGDTDFTVLYTGEDRTAAYVLVSNVRDTMINQHGTGDTCRGAPPLSSRLLRLYCTRYAPLNRTMPNAEPVGTTTSTAITEAWAALEAENLLT